MLNISQFEVKKVDAKGRIILPQKGIDKVFIKELPDVILISQSEENLKNAIQIFEEYTKQQKIKALDEWQALLNEADLTDITSDTIDDAVLRSQKKKLKL